MNRSLFIYNPMSGDHSLPNKLDHIVEKFQERNSIVQFYRLHGEKDKKLEGIIKRKEYDRVIVSGRWYFKLYCKFAAEKRHRCSCWGYSFGYL